MKSEIYKNTIINIIQAYCTETEYKLIKRTIIKSLNNSSIYDLRDLFGNKTPYGLVCELTYTPYSYEKEEFPYILVSRYESNKELYENLFEECEKKILNL